MSETVKMVLAVESNLYSVDEIEAVALADFGHDFVVHMINAVAQRQIMDSFIRSGLK